MCIIYKTSTYSCVCICVCVRERETDRERERERERELFLKFQEARKAFPKPVRIEKYLQFH